MAAAAAAQTCRTELTLKRASRSECESTGLYPIFLLLKTIPTKMRWLTISRRFPIDMRIPPLTLKILLLSNPLNSRILVPRLAVYFLLTLPILSQLHLLFSCVARHFHVNVSFCLCKHHFPNQSKPASSRAREAQTTSKPLCLCALMPLFQEFLYRDFAIISLTIISEKTLGFLRNLECHPSGKKLFTNTKGFFLKL